MLGILIGVIRGVIWKKFRVRKVCEELLKDIFFKNRKIKN